MARSGRNEAAPSVPVDQQRARILALLKRHWDADRDGGLPLSALGYGAFKELRFRRPQGAALAASRTVRAMCDEGLIRGRGYGYAITARGLESLEICTES